ncbi:MAG: phosphoribosylformylglycinamidine synthase subunit PurQ [Armatimonadetes bacterium]|nr:phosphoribosylformylglycinamidine synthase subunit PurQ [Armatimonadota bacterium]
MKVAVIRFPGSNCDQDALWSLRNSVGIEAEYVWHESDSLVGYEGVFLPGGFSYGDYLRCGAMAAQAPILSEVRRFADEGRPVIGACNGFQVLCESGILPGALLRNEKEKFVCKTVRLRTISRASAWTRDLPETLDIPIAHGEGRYIAEAATIQALEDSGRVAFRYEGDNPNGSLDSIAGILNRKGNVLGMMPHPERAANPVLGKTDGIAILRAFELVVA